MSAEPRVLRKVLLGGFVLALLSGCESSSPALATNPQSRLRLAADELTPLAGCQRSSNDPNDMASYVATLIDVTPDEDDRVEPKAVVSGPPTRCTSSVMFAVSADRGELKVGNSYLALVDGYTQSELEATSANARTMTLGGAVANPRWQWLCSFGALSKAALGDVLDIVYEVPVAASPGAPVLDAGLGTTLDTQTGVSSVRDAGGDSGWPRDAEAPDAAVLNTSSAASQQTGNSSAGPNTAQTSADAGFAPAEQTGESTLDTLHEIAKDPTTPVPAELVQSHLGTLRGCVALP